jgi:nitrite reductase (cytochrome c-552)
MLFAKSGRIRLILLFLVSLVLAVGIAMLLVDIFGKKAEERAFPLQLTQLSDDQVQPSLWGKNFPAQWSRYRLMAEPGEATPYGGSLPYSKLIRYPSLTRLWSGYPFSVDFNEERSHYFSQIDQMETKRNNTEWLQQHGFPLFKGQPGACMNCHSGWAPSLIREMGWENFNHTPYADLQAKLKADHGESPEGHQLGSACADCHSPDDMSLRVTRPAYIQAMEARGYKKDPKAGIVATHQEMRSHVCQQCHVEYYFSGDQKILTFPWSDWPKDKPLKIEMIESYYERLASQENGFKYDWIHRESGAPMLKMQHPETELSSSGIHALSGVSCTDCHMPYRREGAIKVTDHFIRSPLKNINASCQTCHRIEEEKLKDRISRIQDRTAQGLKESEGAILALIDDIKTAKKQLEDHRTQMPEKSDGDFNKWVDQTLASARDSHRRASMRWDFVSSENSTGFHSPQESMRVLASAIQLARSGQLELVRALGEVGLVFKPTSTYGQVPLPPEPIADRHPPVGDPPPENLTKYDQTIFPTRLTSPMP